MYDLSLEINSILSQPSLYSVAYLFDEDIVLFAVLEEAVRDSTTNSSIFAIKMEEYCRISELLDTI